jgi:selenide,water dikinase
VLRGAREAWRAGARTGGAERNSSYLDPLVQWGTASPEDRALLIDPQTSGGLLVALPAAAVPGYLSRVTGAIDIGTVVARGSHAIILA